MKLKIHKGMPRGVINAPPSKSMAHRLLISAAMADGTSVIHGVSECEDVRATIECLEALGVSISQTGSDVTVKGINMRNTTPSHALNCHESGSTLRFLLPIALLSGKNVLFSGEENLMRRPMDVYEKLCNNGGYAYNADGCSIAVCGPLKAGEYEVAGNISSQFISGLLFALPTLPGDSIIKILPPVDCLQHDDYPQPAWHPQRQQRGEHQYGR